MSDFAPRGSSHEFVLAHTISMCCASGSSRCSMETLLGLLACCASSSAFAACIAGRKAARRPSSALGGSGGAVGLVAIAVNYLIMVW